VRMSLSDFFNPKSVAVIGASREKGKVGYEILHSLVAGGFAGAIYPVNPKADELEGLKCYADVKDLPSAPDLAVIVVPAKAVAKVVARCSGVGTKSVIVISSGFKEVGEAGRRLEEELAAMVRRSGMRMVGPNCLGLMAPACKLNASFGGPLPDHGHVGFFSQSGSLLAAIVDMARAEGIGFSKLLSIGNKADVNEMDVLRAYAQDDDVKVIAGYLETIADGDAFVREAERVSHDKPILLVKAGETGAGAAAASSHTGRLADEERAYEVVFERAGVIRCHSITEQFDCARAFASGRLPNGPSVAIVANAGGAGIMAADAAERMGLELADLSPETRAELAKRLPAVANISNPVDLLGDALADRFQAALEVVLDDANVHGALVLLTPHAMTEVDDTARAVAGVAADRPDKPILACFLGAGRVRNAIEILRAANIPCYDSPEAGVTALKAMSDYARWRRRPRRVVKLFAVNRRKVENIINRCLRAGQNEVGETDAKEILEAYSFVTPRGMVATSADQAAGFAEQIGYPVVMKIWSPDIVHKAEVGGVRTGLTSRQEAMDAFDLMMYRVPKKAPDANILGVLVQEMCTRGQEVILGMNRDVRYGPLMMFGMGGVMVEVLRDVAFYLAPITGEEAKEMLVNTRTYRLLKGGPGQEGVDIDAIAEGLQRLSQLATEFPQIQEMDINPFVVGPEGVTPIAVDARIVIEKR
jgi:acetyltransferase